jgi:hypothetical protein
MQKKFLKLTLEEYFFQKPIKHMKTYILLLMSLLLCSCDGIMDYKVCIYKKDIDTSKKEIKYSAKKLNGADVIFESTNDFNVGEVVEIRPLFGAKKITKE